MIYGIDRHKMMANIDKPWYAISVVWSNDFRKIALSSESDVYLGKTRAFSMDYDLLKALGNGLSPDPYAASSIRRLGKNDYGSGVPMRPCNYRGHPSRVKVGSKWFPAHSNDGGCLICEGKVTVAPPPIIEHYTDPFLQPPFDGSYAGTYSADLRLVETGEWYRASQSARFWVKNQDKYADGTRFMFSPSGIVFHDDALTAAMEVLATDQMGRMSTRRWPRSDDGVPLVPLNRKSCNHCWATFVEKQGSNEWYPLPLVDNVCRPCKVTKSCNHCNSGIKVESGNCNACVGIRNYFVSNPTKFRGW